MHFSILQSLKMTSNPFISQDRTHFPEFSPSVFSVVKTPSSESGGFKWSIDNLALLKPAEIDTDLANLRGHSPDNGQEAQKAVEQFFSQKTILPSPWTHNISKATPKKVTFSPLPPALSYIQECSLSEPEARDSAVADAGTQTILTLPTSLNVEELLGSHFYNHDDDMNIVNCSLRRKLFGKPERVEQDSRSFCEEAQVDHTSTKSPSSPSCSQQACPTAGGISSTPWMSRFLSAGDQPSASSLLLQSPALMRSIDNISPIRSNDGPKRGNVVSMATPSSTPFREDPAVPEMALGLSPIGLGTIPPREEMGEVETMKKVTSTPMGAGTVAKRQLVSSPFTSPLLKQPCVREQDEGGDQDQGSGDEMAPPLSLVDLQMDITDPSLPSQAAGAPLHSTATGGAPWWQVPVHSTIAESRHLVGNSGPQTSCADSGIATSSEIGSTFGTWNLSKGGTTQGVWCIQPSLSEDEAGPGQTREVTCHHDNEDWSKAGGLGVLHTGNHISGEQLNACLQRSFVPNPALSNAGLCMGTPPSTAVSHHSREHRTPAGLGTPQGGLLPSKFRAIGTPSRYSDLRLGSTPTLKSSGMSFEAEEVLRKKEALKAKMRFDAPLSELSIQMNSSLCGNGAVLTSPVSRASGMGNRYIYTRQRGALVELIRSNQFSIGSQLKQLPQVEITSYWKKSSQKRELFDLACKENVPHKLFQY